MNPINQLTPEQQEAYNEWLLLFGFREVCFMGDIMALDQPARSFWRRLNFTPYIKHKPSNNTYQLKTLEELE